MRCVDRLKFITEHRTGMPASPANPSTESTNQDHSHYTFSLLGLRFGHPLSLHLSGIVFVPSTISFPQIFLPRPAYSHFWPVGRLVRENLQSGLFVHLYMGPKRPRAGSRVTSSNPTSSSIPSFKP